MNWGVSSWLKTRLQSISPSQTPVDTLFPFIKIPATHNSSARASIFLKDIIILKCQNNGQILPVMVSVMVSRWKAISDGWHLAYQSDAENTLTAVVSHRKTTSYLDIFCHTPYIVPWHLNVSSLCFASHLLQN